MWAKYPIIMFYDLWLFCIYVTARDRINKIHMYQQREWEGNKYTQVEPLYNASLSRMCLVMSLVFLGIL